MNFEEEVQAIVNEFGNVKAYYEIEGKVYISSIQAFADLNRKYNLIVGNAELDRFFNFHLEVLQAIKNPKRSNNFMNYFSDQESIMKLNKMLENTDNLIKLIKVHINKNNLPTDIKNKQLVLNIGTKEYNLT